MTSGVLDKEALVEVAMIDDIGHKPSPLVVQREKEGLCNALSEAEDERENKKRLRETIQGNSQILSIRREGSLDIFRL